MYLRVTFALFFIFNVSAKNPFFIIYEEFREWKIRMNKTYESREEEMKRLSIFTENHEYIESHNKKNLSFTLGHNQFSDLTNEEFRNKFNKINRPSFSKKFNRTYTHEKPETSVLRRLKTEVEAPEDLKYYVNWVEAGAVTEIKDQLECESGWAFSTTGAIEGINFITTGILVPLSEQMLIDCDTSVNQGCEGGEMDSAFEWVQHHDGLCSEMQYPYSGEDHGACQKLGCDEVVGSQLSDYVEVGRNDNEKLKQSVGIQPISVAVDAHSSEFQFYDKGIFSSEYCGVSVNIGVLCVGYGVVNYTDFWLVKNSWGRGWGEGGYIRIGMNSTYEEGSCGILTYPSYPVAE